MHATLIVMAAGLATRYGGNKQIAAMGPDGEILLEYSVFDAVRAGFDKVVFVIRPEMLEDVRRLCGDRLSQRVAVEYAFQTFDSLPGWYALPEGRKKPFGTVHAVLAARACVHEPFAVINADDFYGADAFRVMYNFLAGQAQPGRAAMVGYRLKNTVSAHGTVTRGLCQTQDGRLCDVVEVQKICLEPDGSIRDISDGQSAPLDPEALVSMNFWGFSETAFDDMNRAFEAFLRGADPEDLKAEYPLPVMVDALIKAGDVRVDVLETSAVWFGVTYQEDRPLVQQALRALHDQGIYQSIR